MLTVVAGEESGHEGGKLVERPGEEAQVLTIARGSSVRHANQIPFETG